MSSATVKTTRSDTKDLSSIPVPLLDICLENEPLRDEIQQAIAHVCNSGRFVFGPDCEKLEKSLAEICDCTHAIGCASGSEALLLALMATGIEQGDEVIVPSFTFFATASAVWRLGARPVFIDIDPNTFNLNPALLEKAITSATKAIIPVHLFGQCADMNPILEVAHRHKLTVIEDAAQAIGARYNGQAAGSIGDVSCFSFYPTKNLGAFGEGGAITTSNDELAEKLRLLRSHGMHPRYYHQTVGINSRLDSIQAAVLNVKLPHLAIWTANRQKNAQRYTKLFNNAQLENHLKLPSATPGQYHVWNQFTIRVLNGRRDALRSFLAEANIGTEIYYPVPLHQQACFVDLASDEESLEETNLAAAEVLSLPIFPQLKPEQQQSVVENIVNFFQTDS